MCRLQMHSNDKHGTERTGRQSGTQILFAAFSAASASSRLAKVLHSEQRGGATGRGKPLSLMITF